MNLQQLEYILALDRLKSFSKAAESCFITQATLSIMVKRLEDELDIIIFDRKTNPIITTDCGIEIIEEARKIIIHHNRLKQMASELKGKIEGELKIGIIPTIASNLLHRILPILLEKYPKLKLTVYEVTTSEVISRLKTADIDVGIVSTPLNTHDIEEEILYYEKLMVYGNNQTNKKFITPKDIMNEKVWLLEQGNCLRDQIIDLCSINTKQLMSNLNFQPNSFDSLLNIVDKLNGLTLIPELYFLDLPNERRKNVFDFNAPYPVREISMIFHRPYAKLRLLETFAKEIKFIIRPILSTTDMKSSEMKIMGI
jgi:LysR family transcriptional regulator, hydrogen peroxide-inducible genes activator